MSELHLADGVIAERLRGPASRAAAWVRADVPTVARFEYSDRTRPRAGAGRDMEDLRSGIVRWRRSVWRRRALVVLRRNLLLAAALAVVIDLAIWAAGGDRRSWWLLVPLAPALAASALELRLRVTSQETARLLDHGLKLQNRVETAVELAPWASRHGAVDRVVGSAGQQLVARVSEEAGAAVSRSFVSARLRGFSARGEWSALVALSAALVVLLAVDHRATPLTRSGGVIDGHHVRAGDAGRTHGHGAGRHRSAPPVRRHGSATATTPATARRDRQAESSVNPYVPQVTAAQLKRELDVAAKNQGTHDFQVIHTSAPGAGAGQNGQASGGSSPSHSAPSFASHLGSGGGGLSNKTDQVPPGAGVQPSGGGAAGKGRHAATPGGGAAPSAGAGTEQGGGGQSQPGGEQAGTAPGSSALGPGLAPDLPAGSARLPLQAGYAPSTAKHGSSGERSTQTPNGNGVGGRTAVANAGGSEGRAGSGLAVIPPSSDATPTADRTQRNDYFGIANQLQLKSW